MTFSQKRIYISLIAALLVLASTLIPMVVFAAAPDVDLQSFLERVVVSINTVTIPILLAIEIILFIIGVIRYFMNPDTDRTQAAQFIMFTVIAIFATVALLGIVFFIQRSLGVGSGGTIQPPQLSETT